MLARSRSRVGQEQSRVRVGVGIGLFLFGMRLGSPQTPLSKVSRVPYAYLIAHRATLAIQYHINKRRRNICVCPMHASHSRIKNDTFRISTCTPRSFYEDWSQIRQFLLFSSQLFSHAAIQHVVQMSQVWLSCDNCLEGILTSLCEYQSGLEREGVRRCLFVW